MADQHNKDRGWNRSAEEFGYEELLQQYSDLAQQDPSPVSTEESAISPSSPAEEAKSSLTPEKKSGFLEKLFSGGQSSGKGKYYKKKNAPTKRSSTVPDPAPGQHSHPYEKDLDQIGDSSAAYPAEEAASAPSPEAQEPGSPSGKRRAARKHGTGAQAPVPGPEDSIASPGKAASKDSFAADGEKSQFSEALQQGHQNGQEAEAGLGHKEISAQGDAKKHISDGKSIIKLFHQKWVLLGKGHKSRSSSESSLQEHVSLAQRAWDSFKKHTASPAPVNLTFLDWLYSECYFIGIQLMRDGHTYRRQGLSRGKEIAKKIPGAFRSFRKWVVKVWEDFSDSSLAPFREISKKTSLFQVNLQKAGHKNPNHPIASRLAVFIAYLKSLGRPLNQIANFAAPIIGITILAATVTYFSDITFGLRLTYPNENTVVGSIADENVFYDARSKVLERLIGEEYLEPENSSPGFRLAIVKEDNLLDAETLANWLISSSGNEIDNADGIYIEDKFLGAVKDGTEFLLYIDSVLDNYRSGEDHELVQFVKKITLRSGVYPVSSIKSLHDIKEYLDSDVPYEETHVVAEEETLDDIADSYNTTVEQLLLLNPEVSDRMEEDDDSVDLYPGEEILVSQTNLTLGIQVTRREVYSEDVPYGDTKVENDQLPVGYTEVISNGIPGEQMVTADITYIDGEKVAENRISVEVTQEPVNRRLKVGTKPLLQYLPAGSDTSGSFLWPVDGGYMSAGLYGYYGHTGMDIAAPAGTIIRACRAGYVTYASNISIWPYGKRVDINHMDGFTTRYAHMSTVVVSSGTYVEQGQIIGYVGRTGNASGPHCHLEIRLNGVIMNPASYIGTYYPGR